MPSYLKGWLDEKRFKLSKDDLDHYADVIAADGWDALYNDVERAAKGNDSA